MDFKGKNGKTIVINPADFASALELKNAIQAKLKLNNFESLKGADLLKLDAAPFFEILMALDSSKRVNKAIFSCLLRCTYDGEKITEKTFEDIKARDDYYEIIFNCVKENISPFFGGLTSVLTNLLGKTKDSQKPR